MTIEEMTRQHQLVYEYGRHVCRASRLTDSQALIVLRMPPGRVRVGGLVYVGMNNSYNVGKLVRMGLLKYEDAEHDGRGAYVSLTERGVALREKLVAAHEEFVAERRP